ncbi:MAG: DUF445 domain-containing protein [Gammaproteobacteria bacterium]
MNGGTPAPTPPPDPKLVRRLRRMRLTATVLLAAMAAVFAATTWWLPRTGWSGAARAFAEAALIGGLADWFAVVALFRRPLGLPIPHTGVIPARKDEIGRALARFIRDHFLVREAIERRLDRSDLAERLGAWLDDDTNAARVARDLCTTLNWALHSSDGGELRSALGGSLRVAFDAVPVNRAVGTLLDVLMAGDRTQVLIDQLVRFAQTQLDQHRLEIRLRIHEKSPWWLPKFVDQEIFDKLVGEIEALLRAIADDPNHPARADIRAQIAALRQSLVTDSALAAKGRVLRQEVASHPAVRAYAEDLWQRLNDELHTALEDATSPLAVGITHEIRELGAALHTDSQAAARLNGWLRQALLYVVETYRDPLAEVVSDTIESWDPRETSRRIELHIGTDLQYIRINGTLVGGLVGLAIYLLVGLAP